MCFGKVQLSLSGLSNHSWPLSCGQAHKHDPAGAVTSKLSFNETQSINLMLKSEVFLCSGSPVTSRGSQELLSALSGVVSHLLQPAASPDGDMWQRNLP